MTVSPLDSAVSVRTGEELPQQVLSDYLVKQIPDLPAIDAIRQFPSGFSNLTYLIEAGDRQLVLRRPPFGAKVKSGHDMSREYRMLSALFPTSVKVPKPLHMCEDEAVLGAPFYVMERIQGVILRNKAPKGITLDVAAMQAIAATFIDQFVQLHQFDFKAAGLEDIGRPDGYVRRQVSGWQKRYFAAKTDDLPQVEKAARWLADCQPGESGLSLIHNDYKYDNLVLNPDNLGEIRAILDWEMATVGDPLMDLGTSLGYWAEPGDGPELAQFGLTTLDGNPNREALVAAYEKASGIQIVNPVFYYVFGLFKVGVIAQQIYARFVAGHTKDPRFGALIHVVRATGRLADAAITKDRLSDLG
jgi:aminoglycoside phosphotransferase (APT) family kinase protein